MKFPLLNQPYPEDASRVGVLLINLGTPDSPEPASIRAYLRDFLGDPRVVEAPRLLWWLVLRLVILPFRPRHLVDKYRQIWFEGGSPLKLVSDQQRQALDQRLRARLGERINVRYAMTYGNPSISSALEAFQQDGVERILVLPLYPQYSATTTAAAWDALCRATFRLRNIPEIRFVKRYHLHPLYIQALAEAIREHWSRQGRQGLLLFSFHGVPKAYVEKGDPYQRECEETARAVAALLGLQPEQWRISYQSRVGRAEWLTPYTDETMRELGRQGVRGLDVICPGFSADCLETLEEIQVENKALFEQHGGQDFQYIEALNARGSHLNLLEDLTLSNLAGWL